MGPVAIGVDIGQRVDPTALAVIERAGDPFQLRHVERLPLGTKYPQVAARITAVVGKLRRYDPEVLLDATGVGMPVVDLVRAALEAERIDCRVRACWFTHGDRLEWSGNEAKVGKAYLVSRLQALLQQRLLLWGRTAETEYLASELLDYEIRVDENANDRYGAFKVGAHDDVVTTVGLAVIGADRGGAWPMSVAGEMQGAPQGDTLVNNVLRQMAENAAAQQRELAHQAEQQQAEATGAFTPEGDGGLAQLEHEENVLRHQAALGRMLGDLNRWSGPRWG